MNSDEGSGDGSWGDSPNEPSDEDGVGGSSIQTFCFSRSSMAMTMVV